jgi:hypothetical protein
MLGIATVTPSFRSAPPPGSGVEAAQALRDGPPCISRRLGKRVSRTMRWGRWCWGSCVAYRSRRKGRLGRGAQAGGGLLKSTVTCICEAIKDRFNAWTHRDLSGGGAGVPVPGRCWSGWHPAPAKAHTPWAGFLNELWIAGRGRRCGEHRRCRGLIGAVEVVLRYQPAATVSGAPSSQPARACATHAKPRSTPHTGSVLRHHRRTRRPGGGTAC